MFFQNNDSSGKPTVTLYKKNNRLSKFAEAVVFANYDMP
jgi:hypothetical protein